MTAYIKLEDFDRKVLDEVTAELPFDTSVTVKCETVEGRDWNQEWEKNYFKPITVEKLQRKIYTLKLTNMEVESIFEDMVKGWFSGNIEVYYNEFIRALLTDNVRKMNTFMNKVALHTFSSFDSGNKPSDDAEPERFYHGFVLGMVVNLADTYKVRSNRESGYGRYDVMIEPLDKTGKAFIFEFKVLDPDEDEETESLLTFQKMLFNQYKVLSVMNEVLDKLINQMAV